MPRPTLTLAQLGLDHLTGSLAAQAAGIPKETITRIDARTQELWSAAITMWPHIDKGQGCPPVAIDVKGRTAGWAIYRPTPRIRLNIQATREHLNDILTETLPHEMAHIIAHLRYGRRNINAHGVEWQSIMLFYGIQPTRCHNMPLDRAYAR